MSFGVEGGRGERGSRSRAGCGSRHGPACGIRPPLGWAARLRPRLWLVPKNAWAGCPNQHRNRPHQGVIMPKKVLFIVSNAHAIGPHNRRTGNFLPEVAHPYAEFDRAGYQIHFASLTGDTPFLDALNLADDPDNLSFLVGKGWATMQRPRNCPTCTSVRTTRSSCLAVWRRWSTCANTHYSRTSSKRRTSGRQWSERSATDRSRCSTSS